MTREQAEIVVLKDALVQAQHTARFLHDCLIEPKGHKYAYPDMTIRHLEEWRKMVAPPEGCIHSMRKPSCEECVKAHAHHLELMEARAVLELDGLPV